jgi:outer membrane protein TolC
MRSRVVPIACLAAWLPRGRRRPRPRVPGVVPIACLAAWLPRGRRRPRPRVPGVVAIACLAAWLTLAHAGPATASSPVIDPGELPLDTLLDVARQHAPRLLDARAKVALARLDVRGTAWWTWLVPSVTAHQGYDFLTGQERAAVGLAVDLSRFLGAGARDAERARLGLAQAERALAVIEAEVLAEVVQAAYHVTTARATVEVREAAVAHAVKLELLERIKFDHGTGDLAPLLQAEGGLARARLELLQARQAADLAALALYRAVGLAAPAR